jgi:hypothetical protein
MANKNFLIIVNSLNPDELNSVAEILNEHKSLDITSYLLYCTPRTPNCYFQLPSVVLESEDAHIQAMKMLSDIAQHFSINQKNLVHQEGSIVNQTRCLIKQLHIHHVIAGNVVIQATAKKPGKGYFNKEVRMDSINKMDHYCQSCHKHTNDIGT